MVPANVEWRRQNVWSEVSWPWFLLRGGRLLVVLRWFISHLPSTSPRRLYHHYLGSVSITYLYIKLILFVNKNIVICVHYIISIVSFRHEIQRSRKEGCHHQIGFMSPMLVNQKVLNENYMETCQNMYDSLTRQSYKSYIYSYHTTLGKPWSTQTSVILLNKY